MNVSRPLCVLVFALPTTLIQSAESEKKIDRIVEGDIFITPSFIAHFGKSNKARLKEYNIEANIKEYIKIILTLCQTKYRYQKQGTFEECARKMIHRYA